MTDTISLSEQLDRELSFLLDDRAFTAHEKHRIASEAMLMCTDEAIHYIAHTRRTCSCLDTASSVT